MCMCLVKVPMLIEIDANFDLSRHFSHVTLKYIGRPGYEAIQASHLFTQSQICAYFIIPALGYIQILHINFEG